MALGLLLGLREPKPRGTRPEGGGAGIRTQGAREGTTVFKTAPFDRSGTPPSAKRIRVGRAGLGSGRLYEEIRKTG